MSDIESAYEDALSTSAGGEESDLDLDGYEGAEILTGDDDADIDNGTDEGGIEATESDDSDDPVGATDEPEVFDWAEHGNRKVQITVQGQKIMVPLSEALNGYMRQTDYTQKTQQVAEHVRMAQWAQQLKEAFQTDPAGTIGFLQQAYNVNPSQVDPFDDVDPEFRPFAEKLSKIEQENARLRQEFAKREEAREQERVLSEVKSEMSILESEFGEAFDPFEVLPVARDTGLNLRDAFHLVTAKKQAEMGKGLNEARAKAAAKAEQAAKAREAAKKMVPARSTRGTAEEVDSFDTFEALFEHNLKASRR